jgi:oligoendopeptidase F
MPPYSLDIPASSRIAAKLVAPLGNRYVRIAEPAAEKVEWPEVYDGKLGSPISVLMLGSSCDGRGLK